jgi:APA family basic amino acid/polyamine antiporter
MAKDIQEIFNKKIKTQKFNRTINLFGATTIGIGALLGAGIYVLIGTAANVAGPSMVISYLLTGTLAFVTTIMYADLSKIITRSGGGYTYVYSVLGSLGGFTTGWFLALGSLLASSLYAIGFAEYSLSLAGKEPHEDMIKLVAIGITLLITVFNLLPKKENRKFNFQNWIVWGNVAILAFLIIIAFFHIDINNAKPVFPNGFHGTIGAVSLIYISFFGYQLVANNADEIIEPEKTIPKAMKLSMIISTTIYVLVALISVLTVSWKELGESKAPLVLVANAIFGGKGWLIISFGGILASLGALSSTLISQSRQTYTMGKDRFFPDVIGKINEKTKQPQWAVITGGILTSIILLSADLNTIAKVTNFSLIFSMLPVSFTLRRLYRENPSVKPKSLFKRFLPEISLVINLGFLFTLDLVSLALGQQLIIIGALVYFLYSRNRELKGREGRDIVLEEKKQFSFFKKNRILVPTSSPATQKALLMLSNILMQKKGGEIVVLAVKDVPPGTDFYEALADAEETLNIIKRSVELGKENNIKFRPVIRASRNIALGIVHSAEEENCELIVMGYPNKAKDIESTIFFNVLRNSRNDVIALNLKKEPEKFAPKLIGVYVKDMKNLELMLMTATAIAEAKNVTIELIGFVPEGYTPKQKKKADKLFIESLSELKTTALYNVTLAKSDHPEKELIKMSSKYDLLIIGKDRYKKGTPAAELPSFRIIQHAKCSVIMVKTVGLLGKFTSKPLF